MANAFFVRCDYRNRRFTGGKSRFLQKADGRKGIAYAANELCGIVLGKAEGAAEAPAEMAGAFRLGCCTEGMGYLFGIMDSRRTDGG